MATRNLLCGWGGGLSSPRMVGGVHKCPPKSKSQFCLLLPYADGWKEFLKKVFTPFVYVHNDQRVMVIILRYVCRGIHQPPQRPLRPHPPSIVRGHTWEPMVGGGWKKGSKAPQPPQPNFLPALSLMQGPGQRVTMRQAILPHQKKHGWSNLVIGGSCCRAGNNIHHSSDTAAAEIGQSGPVCSSSRRNHSKFVGISRQ